MTTPYANSEIKFVDLDGAWGNHRLIIGGTDATTVRGVFSQIGQYELQEPYGYGPADFALPGLTQFETADFGTGALAWFDTDKDVQLWQYDTDGNPVRLVWHGFITQITPLEDSAQGVTIHCDGDLSGHLNLREKTPSIFLYQRDAGVWAADACREVHRTVTPRFPSTGIMLDSRGRSGNMLSYVDQLLAESMDLDGAQYTINESGTPGRYAYGKKDRTTKHFTVTAAHGATLTPTTDISEQYNCIYGQGVDPDTGRVWVNARIPGFIQGPAPAYPFTDGRTFGAGTTDGGTDTGSGVSDLVSRLVGMYYLGRSAESAGYSSDVTDAVKGLQADAGLSQTGNVSPATWDALFDISVTGYSIQDASQFPLAIDPKVQEWNYTATGAKSTRNAAYDPPVSRRDVQVDFGTCTKQRATRWARAQIARYASAKNWTATVDLAADVAAGEHTYGTTPTPMSRLDITAGMNAWFPGFDGGTLFHVSGVTVDGDQKVTLALDTIARDLITLSQVIARNQETKGNPARAFLRAHYRGTDANHSQFTFSEWGGELTQRIALPGGKWTVFPVLAGQSGTIERVRVKTHDLAEICVAIYNKKITPGYLQSRIGDPLSVEGSAKWTSTAIEHDIDRDFVLLCSWGNHDQPGGYSPGSKSNGDALTGLTRESAGVNYHMLGQPLLYVAIWSDRTTSLHVDENPYIFYPLQDTY